MHFIKKHGVSETGFRHRLQVEPIQLGPIEELVSVTRVEIQGAKMLTLFGGLCCAGFINPAGVVLKRRLLVERARKILIWSTPCGDGLEYLHRCPCES
jgi:hypothetical protein